MKVPTHCLKCGDPLTNDFYSSPSGPTLIIKRCKKRPDHQFQCTLNEGDEDVTGASLSISMNPLIRVGWDFKKKTLFVAKGTIDQIIKENNETSLPYFEPDFSNYNRLVSKLKTYVAFS